MTPRERLLGACYGQPLDRPPVWFMRQAGRMFPEYRKLREQHEFMEICRSPELTSQVTRMPVEQLGVDAAIIFADIMLPLYCLDVEFELVSGTGPVIETPIRTPDEIDSLQSHDPKKTLDFLANGIQHTRQDLPEDIPLIGFAGAPFTMACYLVQGKPSRTFPRAKEMMFAKPNEWNRLLEHLVEVLSDYLRMQVDAGAEVLQLFDSWAGGLNPHHYRQSVLPHVKKLIDSVRDFDVPLIYFSTGNPELLPVMDQAEPDVIGVDWRIDLIEAHRKVSPHRPLQGNLDPGLLLGSWDGLKSELDALLETGENLAGHIVNLGHGVLPDTDPEMASRIVDHVKSKATSLPAE